MTDYTILPMIVVLETDLVGDGLGKPWVSSKYCKAGDVYGKLNSAVFENIAVYLSLVCENVGYQYVSAMLYYSKLEPAFI